MNCISRDKHEVTGFDSPYFIPNSKATLTFQDQNDFVVIGLDVNDIDTVFQSVDVTRQALTVEEEGSLDGVSGCRWVGSEPLKGIRKSMEVLRAHFFLLLAAISTAAWVDVASLRFDTIQRCGHDA
ncbi:MAG TPA: hypothetical protein VFQ55_16430 [Casimicrobiaceae bacterium]|nr:hypothetical protein [Casimicrobiaceae bacterium]